MKQANIIYLLSLLGQSAAKPIDPQVLPKDVGLENFSTVLSERQDGTCSIPNPLPAIQDFYGHLPAQWKIAFAGASIFSSAGSVGAWGFCNAATQHEKENPSIGCTGLGAGVGSVVFVSFAGVMLYLNGGLRLGAQGQGLTGAIEGTAKRGELLVGQMESALRARGVEFDSISTAPLTTRDSADGHTLDILGVRAPGSDIAMDHILSIRDDGTGVSRATFISPKSSRTLAERTAGPGIKVSYNFVKAVDPPRKVAEADLQVLGQNVGQDWENRVNQHHEYSSYFGKANVGPDYTVHFEIIPERSNFGLNYEDVNFCHAFG
ncbi:uncharacterized protein GGS22DRAFT_158415 [Annulohypoxylon maeteangense]|uniref:uncharacterized protein n=1 Tax=Annulohypoxylon maeteangense TaxID=1927788 RepID=UPI0020075953|nr:uncharacterized protein GGS22DRAFT_158415 [Annulohypoxylon maeteangense]KAI0886673.1 hypothetical protein GGS22DRAFT_158415 [Annulohypoxylon maeteangense]